MIKDLIYLHGPKALLILMVLLATSIINKYIQRPLVDLEKKGSVPPETALIINKSIKIVLYAIGLIMALAQLGVDINTILASLGIGGLAIGSAIKDTLTNIICGVIIIAYRPFMIGNHITLKPSGSVYKGKVTDIDFRYVTIESSNNKILIPNSVVAATTVVVKK